ncbi:hypothetical protein SLEP1_g28174 [Rubroshorea leprosula]|uniref:Uncharacterized protein n=1 Tax=Rubroshorea leprosula TaxID=152421 RepID=A0AAV5JZX9_9ROSI|nr:hypothetical protein SLEP1_g28174 [Rubroshorea leprosula]
MATHRVLWKFGGHPKRGIMDPVKIPQGCLFSTRRGGLALIWTDVFRLHQSLVLQSPLAIAIVDPGGCRWRLIGFSGQKQKERIVVGEVGGVLQGENATPVAKATLVPLLNFGNKGLQRIGTVRVMVGSQWRRGRCLGLYGGPCLSC